MAIAAAGCPAQPEGGTGQPTGPGTSITGVSTDGGAGDDDDGSGNADSINPTVPSADSSTGDMNCGEVDFVLQSIPPNVVLVLDRSGSMKDFSWDGDNNPNTPDITRWRSLYNVVESLVGTFDAEINFGAAFFPSASAFNQLGSGACLTASAPEVPVAPMNAAAIVAAMPPADTTTLVGATPATAGIENAIEHLLDLDRNVDRFMILVTDGAANCSSAADTSQCPGLGCDLMEDYDERLPQVVGEAFEMQGIPTFVVGIDIQNAWVGVGPDGMPGTADDDDGQTAANTFERLNDVAIAGGRARDGAEKFFNAQNEIELQMAIDEIAGQVFSCIVQLEVAPLHPDFVEVEIGGTTIPRVRDCETEDGWTFVDPDGPFDAIQLCGSACEDLAGAGELDATYGCPPAG